MTRFFRFDLRTTDADAARAFYAKILGHDRAVIWPLHEQAAPRVDVRWHVLNTNDAARAKINYRDLFGWELDDPQGAAFALRG